MTLKKSHTTFLVILGAFLFAYLSSGSSDKTVKAKDKPQTEKEPAQEQNQAEEQAQPARVKPQANFAPSYMPRIVPPGTRPRVGPTPGVIGEPMNVDPEYNPYAGLTEMMKQRQEQQGNNPPPPDNSQRNLYFETLSNQLKELQGQGNAVIEQDGPVEQQPGPTSVPGIMPTGGLPNGAPLQQIERPDDNLLAPVDPAYNNEVVDESGSDISEEDINNEYDDAVLDEELDRLQEEGLLD